MEWPFVGRESELDAVAAVVREYRARRRSAGAVLAGDAGVGKTRLARAAADAAADGGLEAEWIAGSPGLRTIPFGAFAGLIPSPERGPTDQLQLLQVARRSLEARGRNGGLVLVVDDAHQLDEPSAALMHQLAVSSAVLVLAAFRLGEPRPRGLDDLLRIESVQLLRLGPLRPDDVVEAVEQALGGRLAGRARHELPLLSGGNPLLLRTLVEGLLASGQLVERGASFDLRGRVTPPDGVRSLLRPRVDALTPDQREAAELVALGEPIELGVLERAAGDGVAASLESAGVLTVEERAARLSARLSHPLLAEVVLADLGEARRRLTYGHLASALEERGARRREDVLRLGVWKLRSGSPTDAALLAEAADRALVVFDHELALELADASLARESSSLAQSVRGRALIGLGQGPEALAALQAAAELARSDEDIATVGVALGYLLFFGLGRHAEALARLEDAIAHVSDHDWRGELVCAAAYLRGVLGDFTGMERIDADVLARGDVSPRVEATARLMMAAGSVMLGAAENARRHLERGLELVDAVASVFPVAGDLLHANEAHLRWHEGRLDEAAAIAETHLARALDEVTNDAVGLFSSFSADVAIPRGEIEEAVRLATDATQQLAERDPIGWRPIAHATLALALSHAGELVAAREALEPALAMPLDARSALMVGRAQAWLDALDAPPETAGAELVELGTSAAQGNYRVWAAFTLYDAVRLGRGTATRAPLAELAQVVEGELVATMAAHAAALAARDVDALADVARRFGEMGAFLHAAEAMAQAAAVAPSDSAEGARLASAAAGMFDGMPGVVVPARLHLVAPLTAREREIAWLAAQGKTSREIAEALVLSVRTVDNHLGHVYAKLDLHERAELADVLLGRARNSLERGTRR